MLSSYRTGIERAGPWPGSRPGRPPTGHPVEGGRDARAQRRCPQPQLVGRQLRQGDRGRGPRHGVVRRRAPGGGVERLDWPKADQLAAIASGLASLTEGASRCFEGGLVKQTVVEMERGFLFVMSISDGSCLSVLAASTANVGVVAYEMAVLVGRAGDVLTPSLRAELQAVLPS